MVGSTDPDRESVPDELAAAVGEDLRASDQARPVFLDAFGREPTDATAVRCHSVAKRCKRNLLEMRHFWRFVPAGRRASHPWIGVGRY